MLPFTPAINITLIFQKLLSSGLEVNMVFTTVMELDEACSWDLETVGYILLKKFNY